MEGAKGEGGDLQSCGRRRPTNRRRPAAAAAAARETVPARPSPAASSSLRPSQAPWTPRRSRKAAEDSKTGGAEMNESAATQAATVHRQPELGTPSRVRPPAAGSMARPSKLYLLSYNSLQSLGWFIALLRLLPCLAPPLSIHSAYAVAGELICFLQTCAVLETVHAAIGLVPTSPLLAFLQWGGRTHFALAVVRQIPEVQSSPSVFITFIAWSISEVIRYSHYALTTLKVCPAWLIYLRYTAFIPLYPIGVGPGEMWTIYQALPFVKEMNIYSSFFEKFFMSYHSFLVGGLVCYPFLWLKLYLHMFKQRKSKLGKVDRKKRA